MSHLFHQAWSFWIVQYIINLHGYTGIAVLEPHALYNLQEAENVGMSYDLWLIQISRMDSHLSKLIPPNLAGNKQPHSVRTYHNLEIKFSRV